MMWKTIKTAILTALALAMLATYIATALVMFVAYTPAHSETGMPSIEIENAWVCNSLRSLTNLKVRFWLNRDDCFVLTRSSQFDGRVYFQAFPTTIYTPGYSK